MKAPAISGELINGAGLLIVIVSSCLWVGHWWGETDQSKAERPVLMERRDRETESLQQDIRELRQKLLCPCHE
jgi:hypothetical protein